MKTINIHTSSKTYPLFLGASMLGELPRIVLDIKPNVTKVMVITDEAVHRHYGSKMMDVLSQAFPTCLYVIPSGEQAKSFEQFYQCHTYALEQQLDRHSIIIAFGGGVVGDLAGFVAATYMRGIPFIQVPTTLLAHDSAVGGKVAINHELGKNMIGAFYQPEAVFYDMDFLQSLPPKEWLSGFAEVIKHALISEYNFYDWLTTHIHRMTDLKGEHLSYVIEKGILVKAGIVAEDEAEKGIRAFLNFGHTLGHAIEAALGYGKVTHGEAVVIGMVFALKLSRKVHQLEFDLQGFCQWLEQLGYETSIPASLSPAILLDKMKADKKNEGSSIRMVLLKQVGVPTVNEVENELLLTLLEDEIKGG
ncbi:3-dehydroquinate synthase [Bacillus songklensis]|uniref:3-dehydroquinate synthase n=1 Tax=Bacillus songklensis TaxID=1069116 RepID=A0ABV8B0M5_9BACI